MRSWSSISSGKKGLLFSVIVVVIIWGSFFIYFKMNGYNLPLFTRVPVDLSIIISIVGLLACCVLIGVIGYDGGSYEQRVSWWQVVSWFSIWTLTSYFTAWRFTFTHPLTLIVYVSLIVMGIILFASFFAALNKTNPKEN